MELKRKRRITLQAKAAPVKVEAPKKRKKLTRSFVYRGVHFIATPVGENVRLYTMNQRTMPEYQCTVRLVDERAAVHATAKLLLAEQDLAALLVEDNVNDA